MNSFDGKMNNCKEESAAATAAESAVEGLGTASEIERRQPKKVFPHMENLQDNHAISRIVAAPYHWPCRATMDLKTTALVIIDMQNDCKCCIYFYQNHVIDLLERTESYCSFAIWIRLSNLES